MTTIDTNISNYSLSELIAIADLNELDHDEIISKTDKQIARFKNSNDIKDPNLKELYYYATGKTMENHHNSFKPRVPKHIVNH
jgi:hypothetical protein